MHILDSVRRPFVWLGFAFIGACGGTVDEASEDTRETSATTSDPL